MNPLSKTMIIYRAVKTNWLSQGFGENLNPIYKEWGMLGHSGYDWVERSGKGVYWDTSVRGIVQGVHTDSSGGIGVDIVTETIEGAFKHRFWHLLPNVLVKAGDIVESGDLIGYADTTGIATGSHLHRAFKKVAKDSFGNWVTQDKDNGYFGGIPIPNVMFDNKFILDVKKELKGKVELYTQIRDLLRKLLGLKKQLKNIHEST